MFSPNMSCLARQKSMGVTETLQYAPGGNKVEKKNYF